MDFFCLNISILSRLLLSMVAIAGRFFKISMQLRQVFTWTNLFCPKGGQKIVIWRMCEKIFSLIENSHSSYFGSKFSFMQCSRLQPTLVTSDESGFFTLVTCYKTAPLKVNYVTCLIPKQGK